MGEGWQARGEETLSLSLRALASASAPPTCVGPFLFTRLTHHAMQLNVGSSIAFRIGLSMCTAQPLGEYCSQFVRQNWQTCRLLM